VGHALVGPPLLGPVGHLDSLSLGLAAELGPIYLGMAAEPNPINLEIIVFRNLRP